jgi:RNA polymerase sigma-70 factor, ECF subfamily
MIPALSDNAEFRRSLAQLYPSLLKYARRIARNTAAAEDLVHDAIERGLMRRALFPDGLPGRWINTVLRHLFLDGCRRNRRWKSIGPAWARLHMTQAGLDGWHEHAGESEPALASDAFSTDDVRLALGSLKPGLRDVFCLFVFQRLSQREIGRRLALPQSTVGTRLLRARRKLRQLLEDRAPQILPPPPRPPAPPAAAAALAPRAEGPATRVRRQARALAA